MRRPTRAAVSSGYASCVDCCWTAAGRNALPLAALHYDRTGHKVAAKQTIAVVYGDPSARPGEPPVQLDGQTSLC